MRLDAFRDDEFTEPAGMCESCGVPFWAPHDHRPIGSLTSEEAAAHWSPSAVREREDAKSRRDVTRSAQ